MKTGPKRHTIFIAILLQAIAIAICVLVSCTEVGTPWGENPFASRTAICIYAFLLIFIILAISFVKLNSRRQKIAFDTTNRTGEQNLWIQILITTGLIILVASIIVLFGIDLKNGRIAMAVAIITAITGYVFPDIIKSVVAYLHLSINGHLHIGDWITVPRHGIDGIVEKVSLISVTVLNWDNSTSSIPTYVLLSEQTMNYQKILDGKTKGRRMLKKFIVDTSSVHEMDAAEAEALRKKLQSLDEDVITLDNENYPALNISIYRKYLRHWFMNNNQVFHEPRLLVGWAEHSAEGLPLEVHVFLTQTGRELFEAAQSSITEHILQSMGWFGLRLYQRPSNFYLEKPE